MNAFSNWDEEHLIEAGRQYYATAFPNPDRIDCPDAATMEAMVHRKLEPETGEQIDLHMMQCSPCFNDYVRLREARERSEQRRKLGAIAAVILLAAVSRMLVRSLRGRSTERPPGFAGEANVTYQANLLDLRNKAALRGAEKNGSEAPAVLPEAPLDLSIYLPTGSEPGEYEVQVTQGPRRAVAEGAGTGKLAGLCCSTEGQGESAATAAWPVPVLDPGGKLELELLSRCRPEVSMIGRLDAC